MILRTASQIVTYDIPVDSAINGGGLGLMNEVIRSTTWYVRSLQVVRRFCRVRSDSLHIFHLMQNFPRKCSLTWFQVNLAYRVQDFFLTFLTFVAAIWTWLESPLLFDCRLWRLSAPASRAVRLCRVDRTHTHCRPAASPTGVDDSSLEGFQAPPQF